MDHPDVARQTLDAIISQFAAFSASHGGASETDTRAKVIDRVLKEVLQWPEADISREDHVESGYIDYTLTLHGQPYIAVEAKKEGVAFTIPETRNEKRYVLNGVLVTDRPIRDAINQVRQYCDDSPIPIKYAIATNGYSWIVFRAIREDMTWRMGSARVFRSLEHIRDNFTEFWNTLSLPAIENGSLQEEFSTERSTTRKMLRVVDTLFNADLPLRRNRLNTALQPLVSLIFEDIADQDQIDILQTCYVHTESLRVVQNDLGHIITESIPQFLQDEGTVPVGHQNQKDGFNQSVMSAMGINKGCLFLLLGGIGCGKTTFLKRYTRTSGQKVLNEQTLWFSVDFLRAPLDPVALEKFVWQAVLNDIRHKYQHKHYEKLRNLRDVFEQNIKILESSVLHGIRHANPKYMEILGPYILKWQEDLDTYVPPLLKYSCTISKLKPVLFIDNVDQLAPEYQGQIFLLAQRLTRELESITVVALREESYYTASIQKKFTAYTSSKFHIASPRFRRLISSRIQYAIDLLAARGAVTRDSTQVADYRSISDFLQIVRDSIFGQNRHIVKFIESICYGNMRSALQMFTTFLTSGATDVDKMLRIYSSQGGYNVAYHEFVKAVMLGDRRYYKEEHSPIMNLYNVGSDRNGSHFTSWRIIETLFTRRGESSQEGTGYVPLSELIGLFENTFNNRGDVIAALNRLIKRQLVEANNRSTESVEGVSHVRVTSAGHYYTYFLGRTFAYLDLVLQDTPINDDSVEAYLRKSVDDVDNLSDREDIKLQRVRTRFARVETFLLYLNQEEDREIAEYSLGSKSGYFSKPIIPELIDWFKKDRAWIDRRIIENRERYEDVNPFEYDKDERIGSDKYEDEEDENPQEKAPATPSKE